VRFLAAAVGFLALVTSLTDCRSDARDLVDLAEASWRNGDYANAIRLHRLVVARKPASTEAAQALLSVGTIYYRNLRQIRRAIETYREVADGFAGRPEEYQARLLLAEVYTNEVGDLTQAIAEYDRLLSWPELGNREEIQFRRAGAYFEKEDFDRALRELRNLEEAGVRGHLADQVSLKVGNIYQIQKRYEEALVAFERVSRSSCTECRRRAILNLVETYESLYDFDKAIETVHRLEPSAENEAYVRQEVSRLEARRKLLDGSGDAGASEQRKSRKQRSASK
jgi:tetratricopeptide (TPR) repeat protein